MNIENYRVERFDLMVATAVNSYLKGLTPEARKETLAGIVREDGAETVIDGPALAALIENAKAAAMVSSEEWKKGGDLLMKKTRSFIRETLPMIEGAEYVKAPPEEFLRFIEDWTKE